MTWIWEQIKNLRFILIVFVSSLTFFLDVKIKGENNTAQIRSAQAQITLNRQDVENQLFLLRKEYIEGVQIIQKQNNDMQRTLGRIEGKVGKLAD